MDCFACIFLAIVKKLRYSGDIEFIDVKLSISSNLILISLSKKVNIRPYKGVFVLIKYKLISNYTGQEQFIMRWQQKLKKLEVDR